MLKKPIKLCLTTNCYQLMNNIVYETEVTNIH